MSKDTQCMLHHYEEMTMQKFRRGVSLHTLHHHSYLCTSSWNKKISVFSWRPIHRYRHHYVILNIRNIMLFRYEQYFPITTTVTKVKRVTFKCSDWLYGAYGTRHTQWQRHCTLYFRGHKTQVSVGKTNWKRSLLFRMHNTNPLDCLSRGIWRSFHCGEAEDIVNTHFKLLYASWHTSVSALFAKLLKQRSRPGHLDYHNLWTRPCRRKKKKCFSIPTCYLGM